MASPTYSLIASNTVGSGGAASVTFSSIPQTYTDLMLVYSARTDYSGTTGEIGIWLSGDTFPTAADSFRTLEGSGSAASSTNNNTYNKIGNIPGSTATSNTFGNGATYFPNYTPTGTYKSFSTDHISENNATAANAFLGANLRAINGAITSLQVWCSLNFVQYSSFYLYGLKNA